MIMGHLQVICTNSKGEYTINKKKCKKKNAKKKMREH